MIPASLRILEANSRVYCFPRSKNLGHKVEGGVHSAIPIAGEGISFSLHSLFFSDIKAKFNFCPRVGR